MKTQAEAGRAPDDRKLLNVAGMLLLVVAGGRMAADLVGVGDGYLVGVLAVPLVAYFGLLAANFRGWPQEVVDSDPFRRAEQNVGSRAFAWTYATTGRVRWGAGVLAIVSVVWTVDAVRVLG